MKYMGIAICIGMVAAIAACGQAPPPPVATDSGADSFVARMMAFDANHDGKLTREEVTDERLLRLFDRADADQDGVVTKDELSALFVKEGQTFRGGGGPGGRGRGPGMGMGPMEPGQVLPGMMQERLQLTDEQKKKVAELQHEVDAKLAKILNASQREQLRGMKRQGPPPGPPSGPPPGNEPH